MANQASGRLPGFVSRSRPSAGSALRRLASAEPDTTRPPAAAVAAIGLAGIVFTVGLANAGDDGTGYGLLRLFVGASFIGVGLYAWWRRATNLIGPLMIATGFLWFVAEVGLFTESAVVFTLSGVIGSLYHSTSIHLLAAFPSGRLESRAARLAALAGYVVLYGGTLLIYLVADPGADFGCTQCPDNVLQVVHSSALADVLITGVNLLAAAVVAAVVGVLISSWRHSVGWRRRALTPLLFAGAGTAFLLGLTFVVLAFNATIADDIFIVATAAFGVVPYAFVYGLARSAMLSSSAVGELVGRLTEARDARDAQQALRDALGDPSLEFGFRRSAGEPYVSADGRRLFVPGVEDDRALTFVEVDAQPVAAIAYDSMLLDDPQLVDAARNAIAVALEKHQLDVELALKVEELRASRERIVKVAYDERRRLERNLHDGAQQRLISLALKLRMARAALGPESPAADEILESTAAELDLALGELRELARGLHPAVLSDRGLGPALSSLAARSPIEVGVEGAPTRRLPASVELAAYFLVSEALANTIKHAHASAATVAVATDDRGITVEVSDDGVGGADPTCGSGLRGLSDRLSALGGRLDVISAPGQGTLVRARIPCE
jgi:signal transduction histidine kinase